MKNFLSSLLIGGFLLVPAVSASDFYKTAEEGQPGAHVVAYPVGEEISYPTLMAEGSTATQFPKMTVKGVGVVVSYNDENYIEKTKEIWTHNFDENFSVLSIKTYIETIEGNPEGNVDTSPMNNLTFPHVTQKPTEDYSEVLLKRSNAQSTVRQHYFPTGKTISQWQIKDGFKIFKCRYTQTSEELIQFVNGSEKVVGSRIVDRNFQQFEQIFGKKGKDTWFSDPAGQGAGDGEAPTTDTAKEAMFNKYFGAR